MLNITLSKTNYLVVIAVIATLFGYYYFGYELNRADFSNLLFTYSGLFLLFFFLVKRNLKWTYLVIIALIFRVIFLIATPSLSQDFYRFIWDGRLLLNGFNPYLYLPKLYLSSNYTLPNQAAELVAGMGELNASHYSNYPPLNQLCFAIAALLANKSILGGIVVMRTLIILADVGVLYFGSKLLKTLNLNPKAIFIYLLNPLIIIELTGNLHFEGVMVFFLVWSLYLLQLHKWKLSSMTLAASIGLKLLPLLFLPLYFKQFKLKKLITFYLIIGVGLLILLLPFLSENLFSNYSKTVGLWFGTFEFNGSLYLLVREIGFIIKGYNIIATVGKITPILVIVFVTGLAISRKNITTKQLITIFLFALSFYLFTSSTIHPWYLAMLLILSIFTTYRFPLLWSFTIILSYSFYQNDTFINNYWLITTEYVLVFGFMIWELITKRKKLIETDEAFQ